MQISGCGSRLAKFLPNARIICGLLMPFSFKAAILMFSSLMLRYLRLLCFIPLFETPLCFPSTCPSVLPFQLLFVLCPTAPSLCRSFSSFFGQLMFPGCLHNQICILSTKSSPASFGSLAVVIGFANPTFSCPYVKFGAESFLAAASTLHRSVRPCSPFSRSQLPPFNAPNPKQRSPPS